GSRTGRSRSCPESRGRRRSLDERPYRPDHLLRCGEIGTVAGRLQDNHPAVWEMAVDEFADLLRSDDVLAALEDEDRNVDAGQVVAVVGREGHAGKGLRDLRISAAETVGQFFPKLRPVRIAHD